MNFWQVLATTTAITTLSTNLVQGAEMIATQTDETIGIGLKVYQVQLIDDNGQTVDTIRAVSGRAGKQTPSHKAGSQTPLPFGIYQFSMPGNVSHPGGEFGGAWSPIIPTFETGRSGIGLHYDPSAFKNNGQAGTAGCLATPTIEEREIMTQFIRAYKPTQITVRDSSFPNLPNRKPLSSPFTESL
ncbi:L,D-transpeptidase [Lusitaniella coriacea]|uniref:L,D-transpeptidase n=1 Tax=Lusitaniella coriacea TaxID=1983105 RepID=UPI003CFB81A1